MLGMTISANIAKRAILFYSATNAVPLVSATKHLKAPRPYLSLSPPLSREASLVTAAPHLHLVKGKVVAHDTSESDPAANGPPEIPSVPEYVPSFPPEVLGPNSTPSEVEPPVGPEIVPDPVPRKPPLEPPTGPDFPGPPTPSPPGPDIPLPPPPNTVPPPPPDVVPSRPPEIVPPPPNMPPHITPPAGPFAVAGRGTAS
ncbi:protein TRACHEARY ELEMENT DIFFERENTIATION-RELATED 7A-like [Macadamia integrifolia]|uniref:protein TRACHEARY ELEMENT DIFFERENTIATION-RELATED 7A-like n=1 Tax=Macadamia integrifolia TaxID=60698 RepID=UPI001C4EAF54|nr:protein TRACHEARY ELEMENT DIFFERENTIATION-RELATED 7A-like [Macadamia integrifolia]